jgi:2-polyprenyl-3-methyl-5-hydroxy-6-metoxy-1,4-benzoquinol methylase
MFYDTTLYDMSKKPKGYYSQRRSEMIEFIPNGAKRILDIGCGEGVFGEQLKEKLSAEVWGVEVDKTAGAIAQTKYDRVYIGDILKLVDGLPVEYFDCIVFNDVLEHLVDPFGILVRIKNKLIKGGVIISSIPNVRHYSVLKDLLIKKQWKYRDVGVLDKTHLRFFTLRSIIEMFNSLDYYIVTIKGINQIRSRVFSILNVLSFGYLSDTKYLRFVCVAKPK